jgi:hypothetical protein
MGYDALSEFADPYCFCPQPDRSPTSLCCGCCGGYVRGHEIECEACNGTGEGGDWFLVPWNVTEGDCKDCGGSGKVRA